MKIAICVPLIVDELARNLEQIGRAITEAAVAGADLLVLPEACLTGLPDREYPEKDILLARCFSDGTDIAREWETEERRAYIEQLESLGKEAIMGNYLSPEADGRYFGGALHLDAAGKVENEVGVLRRDMIVVEI